MIHELVDEEAIPVLKARQHAGAFHAHRLVEEHDDQHGDGDGDKDVANPQVDAVGDAIRRELGRRQGWLDYRGRRG